MDIYSYIRSRDVAEHCRKLGKTWNTCEMAIIIARSGRPQSEVHAAWRELIAEYPDTPAIPSMYGAQFESVHKKLAEIIADEENGVDHGVDVGSGIKAYSRWEGRSIFSRSFIDIPVPFKRGDILTYAGTKGSHKFMLDSLACDDPDFFARALCGETGDSSDMGGWGYFVGKNGLFEGDHIFGYDKFEYYQGKLEGLDRLLHYAGLFLKDEISIASRHDCRQRVALVRKLLEKRFPIAQHFAKAQRLAACRGEIDSKKAAVLVVIHGQPIGAVGQLNRKRVRDLIFLYLDVP